MEPKQNTSFRLDDNVVIAFLVACVLGSMAFAVRYSNYKPCRSFSIKTLTTNITTGTLVRFEADVAAKYKVYEWDFGDNQDSKTASHTVVHSFDRPGEYIVTLKLDNRCLESTTIYVQQAAEIVDSSQMPRAIIPETAEINMPITFHDTTHDANAWEWRFGETDVVDAFSKDPTYVYKQPGWKTITLTVNGNNRSVLVKKIFVNPPREKTVTAPVRPQRQAPRGPANPRPETDPLDEQLNPKPQSETKPEAKPAPPPVVKAPDLSIQDLKKMLYGVADKKLSAASFAKYFCNNTNIYTNVNGKSYTFAEYCSKLANLKRGASDIKKMSVIPTKNIETNCITSLNIVVTYRQGLFGLSSSK
ncbi:hypothetical protein GCM10027051_15280 [Niabella terrae]